MSEMAENYGGTAAEGELRSHDNMPLAPAWHTILLVLIILGTSASGYITSRRYVATGTHGGTPPQSTILITYASTLALEWFLFFFVRWGERMREASPRSWLGPALRARIGGSWRNGRNIGRDIAVALGVWAGFLIIEGALGFLLKPEGSEVVKRLVPHTIGEMLLWIPVCISAGFCEELCLPRIFSAAI